MGTTYLYGRDIAAEVESYWMVPLLVESETDKVMSWQLALSLWSKGQCRRGHPEPQISRDHLVRFAGVNRS